MEFNFKKACIDFGEGVTTVSLKMGMSRSAISLWERVPDGRVLDFCATLNWNVTPHQVRPDLYPNALDALPTDHALRRGCSCSEVSA